MTVQEFIECLQDEDPKAEVLVLTGPVETTGVSHISQMNAGAEVIIELSGLYYHKQLQPPTTE